MSTKKEILIAHVFSFLSTMEKYHSVWDKEEQVNQQQLNVLEFWGFF